MTTDVVTLKRRLSREMERMQQAVAEIDAFLILDTERAAPTVKAAEVFLAGIGPALARLGAIIDPEDGLP